MTLPERALALGAVVALLLGASLALRAPEETTEVEAAPSARDPAPRAALAEAREDERRAGEDDDEDEDEGEKDDRGKDEKERGKGKGGKKGKR